MFHSFSLKLFWFVYMGSVGIVLPYYSLYLKENAGLSGTELGWVLAILPLVGIAAQPFWGQVADRTGARSPIVGFLALGTALGYLALAAAEGFWAISAATAAVAPAAAVARTRDKDRESQRMAYSGLRPSPVGSLTV